MNIAIVGAGFTGLSAGYRLSREGHTVTIYEKEGHPGGLASTFRLPGWKSALEKHYHHWFTNDAAALGLIKDLGLLENLVFPKTITAIYYRNGIYPFNGPGQLLAFSPLTAFDRMRMGMALLYMKLLPKNIALYLEKTTAYAWLTRHMGENGFGIVWKPLLDGKFSHYSSKVNMSWFWARIKKRTSLLGYLKGGYGLMIESLEKEIRKNGGTFLYNRSFQAKDIRNFDRTIVTVPSKIFTDIFSHSLPSHYIARLNSIPHLHAHNLLLITKEKFLKDVYWLNINDRKYPFIAVIQHTNMMDASHYGGNHLTWIANYLPPGHRFLKMNAKQLFAEYLPFLKKINPGFNYSRIAAGPSFAGQLFSGPFAQPIFYQNYSKVKPDFRTPVPDVYLANMDMVYPWDRGTNYAIELGYQVAELVTR